MIKKATGFHCHKKSIQTDAFFFILFSYWGNIKKSYDNLEKG